MVGGKGGGRHALKGEGVRQYLNKSVACKRITSDAVKLKFLDSDLHYLPPLKFFLVWLMYYLVYYLIYYLTH